MEFQILFLKLRNLFKENFATLVVVFRSGYIDHIEFANKIAILFVVKKEKE